MIGRAQSEGNSYGDGNRRRDATDESSARGAEGELYRRDARKPRGTHRPHRPRDRVAGRQCRRIRQGGERGFRSEEHTSELQSLMRISYAVFCLKKKKKKTKKTM